MEQYKQQTLKSEISAYLTWFIGLHFAYLRNWGLLFVYWLTFGGFGIWALIELFMIPSRVNTINQRMYERAGYQSTQSEPVSKFAYTSYPVLVGVSYRKAAYAKTKDYEDLILKREPDNEYSSKAVAVYHEPTGNQLGYMASEYSREISEYLDEGLEYDAYIFEKRKASVEVCLKTHRQFSFL